jgi:hypothetical protein
LANDSTSHHNPDGKVENLNPPTNGYVPIYDHIYNLTETTGGIARPNIIQPKLIKRNPRDPELDLGNHAWYVQLGWANSTVEVSAAANAFYISGSGTNKLRFGHIANAHSFVTDGHFFVKANTRILSAYGIGDYAYAGNDGLVGYLTSTTQSLGPSHPDYVPGPIDEAHNQEPLGINWDDGRHTFERWHGFDSEFGFGVVGTSRASGYEIAEYSLVGGRSPYGFINMAPGGKMTQNAGINLGMSGSEYITGNHDHHLYASTWINSDVNIGANVAVFSNTGISV